MVLPLFLVNLDVLKPTISKFILNQIRSKINAEVIFANPHYEFKRFKLFLTADQIRFTQDKDIVIDLTNFKLIYPLRNILRSTQIITSISADKLFIKAIQLEDGWNLESILKPSKKHVDFLFKSLNLHDTDLEIYSKNYFEKQNVYLDIHRDKVTKLYDVEFYNNQEIKALTATDINQVKENQFYIAGEYDLNNNEGVYKYVKNLNVALFKLKPSLINLISRAFTDRKSRFMFLFNKYSLPTTELSLFVKELKDEETYSIDLDLDNLVNDENFHLDSELHLAQDVNINNLSVIFIKANLSAKGTIKNAFLVKPSLDLNLVLSNFNPYLFRNKFPEIKKFISDKVVNLTSTIHKSPIFDLTAKITGDLLHPELDISLPIENLYTTKNATEKSFNLNLVLREKDYLIKKLLVPFEFADMNINGIVAKSGAFDLKLQTQDFPLRSLKPIAMGLLTKEESSKIKDLIIQGYLKSDLTIKKQASQELPEFYGTIVLAETSILEPNIPVLMQNISADLSAEKDLIKISSFVGSLYENDVDLNGFYNIHTNQHKINLSSPSFDLAKIEGYQIKKYIPEIENFTNIKGRIDNLEINSDGDFGNFATAGNLAEVQFDYTAEGKTINLNKLSAEFAFAKDSLTIKDLIAYINDNSSLKLEGLIDFNNKNTSIKAIAKKLPFELLSLLKIKELPIHAKDGIVNFDLDYKPSLIKAKGNFSELSFNIDSKKMPEYFRSVNAEFEINKDIYLNGFTAFYGNSLIEAKTFLIKDFQSKDKYYDLDIRSDLKISEFESLIPSGIAELLHMKGYLPLHVKAKGDKQKFYLNVDGNLNKLESLVFADWLDYDTTVNADFTTSFSFTPKLILSRNTVLNLNGPISKTTIAADFEVHDWKEKNELRYSIDAYTPLDVNGNFIPVDLDLIEPHIKSIETLNLDPGTGTVQCRTDGDTDSRHTFCDIDFLDKAVARNFGIGDLVSEKSSVNLIAIRDKPVYVKVKLNQGVWKILDYLRVNFDMEITEDLMKISRLRAKLDDGFIRSNITFNFKTLASKFKIKANNVPAHEAAESFFALGYEVPQGTVSGQFEGTTKGLLPDEMFLNLVAECSLLARDGKLSSLKTMQKLLSAINTIKNFDFNNVFQTLITYKGGLFSDLVSYIKFDKGKITTDKLILHSEQIELHLEGYVDYAKDYLMVRGLGAVPERSRSFLQLLGVKQFNIGNLLSIINLRNPGSKDKDYFAFSMKGPVNNLEEATLSLRQNFTWLNSYGSSD
jgi:hypothetical protein